MNTLTIDEVGIVAANVGDNCDWNILPFKWGGHCYYARKCMTGETKTGDIWDRNIGGIAIPETVSDRSCWLIVLGVGPRVGKRVGEQHAKLLDRPTRISNAIRIGDCIVCPNMHVGIQRSPLAADEYFIEESVPEAVVERNHTQ